MIHMNKIKKKMLDILKELKNEYGVIAIKAEFEAEGSRLDELIMLNEVVFRADMDIFIKIGGCEAVRDLDQCKLLGASGIMAPMIETPFAMKKFVNAAKKVYKDNLDSIEWIINTETKTCLENFDDILVTGKDFLNTIVIGRTDFVGSFGLTRAEVNGDFIFEKSMELAKKAKEANLKVGIGGTVALESVPFFIKMKPFLDKFETRKVVFSMNDNPEHLKKGIVLAMAFEMLYLKNKCDFYQGMESEDQGRLKMLEQRCIEAKESLADIVSITSD